MRVSFSSLQYPTEQSATGGTVVLGVYEGKVLSPFAEKFLVETCPSAVHGAIMKALTSAPMFDGKPEQTTSINGLESFDKIIFLGLGQPGKLQNVGLENLGGAIYAKMHAERIKQAVVIADFTNPDGASWIASGFKLRAYRFDQYKTKPKPEQTPCVESLTIQSQNPGESETSFSRRQAVIDGVYLARDLVSEPGNIIFPKSFAEICKSLKKLGVSVTVLGQSSLEKLGMGALLGVAQGSIQEPQVVVMEWNGGTKGEAPVAFVGKGVTFDSGGLSIKPAQGMEDMKTDMHGAATVVGVMHALAARKARVNAVGVVGLVENMPSGNAQRPGDIVRSMSGQTIEVLNTDAEGRLVLADVLWYCQKEFNPVCMIDLATLTGAMIIALGRENAGLFCNDDTLASQLTQAGQEVAEKLWRLPLDDAYDREIDSDIADMRNISISRGEAGSITAAKFLQRFVESGTRWAHIDIAGVSWTMKDKPLTPKGAYGFGVRLLDRLVSDHYEGA